MDDINTEKYTEDRFLPFYEEARHQVDRENYDAEIREREEFTSNR